MTLTPCQYCGNLVSRNTTRKNIVCAQCKRIHFEQYRLRWRETHPMKGRGLHPTKHKKTGARINPGTHKKAVVH